MGPIWFTFGGKAFDDFSLQAASEAVGIDFSRLPSSMRVRVEKMITGLIVAGLVAEWGKRA